LRVRDKPDPLRWCELGEAGTRASAAVVGRNDTISSFPCTYEQLNAMVAAGREPLYGALEHMAAIPAPG